MNPGAVRRMARSLSQSRGAQSLLLMPTRYVERNKGLSHAW